MALNPFKLQKLRITSYAKQERQIGGTSFEVMFNPAAISERHQNKFSERQGINTKSRTAQYAYSHSKEIELELVLDGTGVTDFGATTLLGKGTKSVPVQIKTFQELCFHMDGRTHEPKFLKIQWGEGVLKDFDCRLKSVDIKYSLFDKSGAPLHAVLTAVFFEDVTPAKRVRQEGKSSPDLSHTRVVKSGDTLPLLVKEIYGSSQYYLRVAQVNHLDDFRNLTPGQEIIFPPLVKRGE